MLEELRSQRWFGATDLRSFGHRSRMLQMGYERDDFMGKPVVGIINTWSDINPVPRPLPERVEDIKRGVWQAGGFPIELPAISLSENFVKPTTMLYRNFLAMETEELLRQHPVDGAVLMGGCDKTTPGTIMGGISMNLPMIFMPAGPMMRGHFGGNILGSGSDVWKYWAEKEAGNITIQQWNDMEAGIARSAGTCMTMGTASTMTSIAEALGLTLPGARPRSRPATPRHPRMASACGRRIVEMIWEDLKPSDIIDRRSVDNALVVHNALAGSTNAMIHLVAMARRAGVPITLQDFDDFAQKVPVIANVRPSGEWLMEDFFIAGGIRALFKRLEPFLHLDARTVVGHDGRRARGRGGLQRRRDPSARQAHRGLGRHGDPVRQHRARRLRDQAARRRAAAAQAHRPGAGVRQLRRDVGGRERPRPRRHAGPHHGAAQRRAGRRAGHARVGHAARCRRSC